MLRRSSIGVRASPKHEIHHEREKSTFVLDRYSIHQGIFEKIDQRRDKVVQISALLGQMFAFLGLKL